MWKLLIALSGGARAVQSNKQLTPTASVGVAMLCFWITHMVYLVYYITAGILPLVLANAMSVTVYLVAAMLNHKGHSRAAVYLANTEISFYCIAGVVILGWEAGTVWFLPFCLFLYPFYPLGKRCKHFAYAQLAVSALLCFFIRQLYPPLYPDYHLQAVNLLHMLTLFFGASAFLSLNNMRVKISEGYYEKKITNLASDAHIDALTGLFNRRYAMIQLKALTAKPNPQTFTVAMLDVDFFKQVNDTYGHSFGDVVLQSLADSIQHFFRSDDIGVRWGGEEFLIIFPSAESHSIQPKMEAFLELIEHMEVISEDTRVRITLTVGISESSPNKEITQVIEESDAALYYGKRNGRNQVNAYADLPAKDKLSKDRLS